MAKIEGEKTKSDEIVENLRIALAELCFKLIDDIRNKQARNPEIVFKSMVEIYNVIKN